MKDDDEVEEERSIFVRDCDGSEVADGACCDGGWDDGYDDGTKDASSR